MVVVVGDEKDLEVEEVAVVEEVEVEVDMLSIREGDWWGGGAEDGG